MGSEKQKGGGVGQQAVGQTQHLSRNCGISAKGAKKKLFLQFLFCGTHFCEGHKAKNSYFFALFFFAAKQHLRPGINYFSK